MASWGLIIGVVAGLYMLRKLRDRRWPKCKSTRRMEGKVVVVTGANTGIGWETTRELARRGAIVVLACRDQVKARSAVDAIRVDTTDGDLIIMSLDLADLASIRTFAANFCKKFEKLDVLVNNAGVYVPPDVGQRTRDGFEIHFGVNHLGHFLLTHLLFSHIKNTANSRIVNVSSELYKQGHIDFENLNGEKGWDPKRRNSFYCTSKLANILHSRELAKRLEGTSTGVFALSPGFVATDLFRYSAHRFGWIQRIFMAPVLFFMMRGACKGAQSSIHCAVSEELDGVEWAYVRDCKPAEVTKEASDPEVAARLWQVSLRMVGESEETSTGVKCQEIGHQEAVCQKVVPKEVANDAVGEQETAPKELADQEVRRRQVAQQEIAPKEKARKEVTSKDVTKQEVGKQEVTKEIEPILAKERMTQAETKLAPEVGRVLVEGVSSKDEGLARVEEIKGTVGRKEDGRVEKDEKKGLPTGNVEKEDVFAKIEQNLGLKVQEEAKTLIKKAEEKVDYIKGAAVGGAQKLMDVKGMREESSEEEMEDEEEDEYEDEEEEVEQASKVGRSGAKQEPERQVSDEGRGDSEEEEEEEEESDQEEEEESEDEGRDDSRKDLLSQKPKKGGLSG